VTTIDFKPVQPVTLTICSNHRVADERGQFAGELPAPACQPGVTYGI